MHGSRQHLGDLAGSLPQVDRLRPQGLLARESQQLSGQPLAAIGGAQNGRGAPLRRQALGLLAQQLGIGAHHRQQIVEIMGNAASQAADRFHALGLTQGGLGVLPFRDFDAQLPIGGG